MFIMKRTTLFFYICSCIFLAGCSSDVEDISYSDYNIILVSLDTLRADHMGCYGYHRDTTPNIDKLAEKSIIFDQFYAQSHNTIVSHATMFSSLYPMVHVVTPKTSLQEKIKTLAEYFQDAGYATAAFTAHSWLSEKMGFNQGFESLKSQQSISAEDNNKLINPWLEKNRKRKFFLFLHYFDVHSDPNGQPYETGSEFDKKFTRDYAGVFTRLDDNMIGREFLVERSAELGREDLEYVVALYDGGIAYTDYYVGKVLEILETLQLLDKTIIIITSDHGEAFGEHGKFFHQQLYKEDVHVPFIIRIPGQQYQERIPSRVGIIDIMPTMLDMANIPYSEELQGESLLPLMKESEKRQDYVISTGFPRRGGYSTIFLRDGQWNFYTKNDFTKNELYDFLSDRNEANDLSNEKTLIKENELRKIKQFYREQEELKDSLNIKLEEAVPFTEEEVDLLKRLGYLD